MTFPTVPTTATTAYSADQTGHTINLPSGITAGDLLLLWFCRDNTTGTVSTPSGWTVEQGPITQNDQSYLFSRIADGTEGGTVSITTSNSESSTALALRISGRVSHVSSNAVNGSAQYANPATVTATASVEALLVHFGSALGNATINASPNGDATTLFVAGNSGDANNTVTAFAIWAPCTAQNGMDAVSMAWNWNTGQHHRLATVLVQGTVASGGGGGGDMHPLAYTGLM